MVWTSIWLDFMVIWGYFNMIKLYGTLTWHHQYFGSSTTSNTRKDFQPIGPSRTFHNFRHHTNSSTSHKPRSADRSPRPLGNRTWPRTCHWSRLSSRACGWRPGNFRGLCYAVDPPTPYSDVPGVMS